jgi:hypothetical protein
MTQLNNEELKKPMPSGKPVKSKKSLPTKKEPAKIPVPCYLSEGRIREIAREETIKYMNEVSIRRMAVYES